MLKNNNKLIIVGAGETAQIAYDYFNYDSPYRIVAFSVEKDFLKNDNLFDLPVIPFENLEHQFDQSTHQVFVAISYTQLNRIRTRLYQEAKRKGFRMASYISSRAFVGRNVKIGENCFILENNVIQYHAKIGNNVTLWSGNHIGHRSVIKDNCYISSHVVISGFCTIGANSFLGVNSCLNDQVKIGKDCVIGSGAVLIDHAEEGKVYVGNPAQPIAKTGFEVFNVPEAMR